MDTSRRLTVMSANLWNLNGPLAERMGRFSDMIDEFSPDVIAMQEVRPMPGSSSHLQLNLVPALARFYVHHAVATSWPGGAEGLAIATTSPAVETHSHLLPDGEPDFEPTRAVQYVRIPSGDGFVGVLNTHLAYHPDSEPLRLKQVEFVGRLAAEIAEAHSEDALVVCGDLNSTPASAPVARLQELGGLENPWRDMANDRFTYSLTNPYIQGEHEQDSWLDYILTRRAATSGLTLVDDWPDGPASDHHFVLLEVEPAGD